ncbi:hypothetical protein DVU_2597 [Nitratidesulfovibrio vulgaris str. Hildenborough]|uniref:Uncharacterized protein n=1 Tax=Nitratidesulfovibrio vulgaris (strain ATCC 29579 / DSM 644 / CCUG 34227 / NCIMB 8303 / VKM B-1760 / Hildenborough) TaxID=882 RepID=Q728K6_NITV2|nr:hypothetical protein DVU_2597 [Nitratidesulfovibrio vulgaris str. Hildenborough]
MFREDGQVGSGIAVHIKAVAELAYDAPPRCKASTASPTERGCTSPDPLDDWRSSEHDRGENGCSP